MIYRRGSPSATASQSTARPWAFSRIAIACAWCRCRAATAIANIGPGLGEIIGPAGNFGPLNDTAKWMLSVGMLCGRLELMAVYAILTVQFWRA